MSHSSIATVHSCNISWQVRLMRGKHVEFEFLVVVRVKFNQTFEQQLLTCFFPPPNCHNTWRLCGFYAAQLEVEFVG